MPPYRPCYIPEPKGVKESPNGVSESLKQQENHCQADTFSLYRICWIDPSLQREPPNTQADIRHDFKSAPWPGWDISPPTKLPHRGRLSLWILIGFLTQSIIGQPCRMCSPPPQPWPIQLKSIVRSNEAEPWPDCRLDMAGPQDQVITFWNPQDL